MSETPNKSSPAMRAAVAGSALLVVAGLATFWWAAGVARKAPPKAVDHAVTVTIQGNVCEPNDITVPAGRTTFTIVNQSQRALEWEILDGVRVVEERENIAPGFSQTMTAKLLPGDYAITCGLLSNPRGRLHVTPTAESDAEAARPSQVAYVGALAEYRVFLALAGGDLQDATQALADAITSGDLQQARALYVPAHQAYKRVEPMAELFADLDQRLNARADYFEKREADPAFTGASKLLRRVADNLPAGGEDRHGHAEAANLQATLDGTKKLADLLSPLLAKAAPDLDQAIAQHFAAFSAALDPYREGEGFKAAPLNDAQRQAIAAPMRALADDLGKVNAALGLG
jgi:iron uptake system component EfeO